MKLLERLRRRPASPVVVQAGAILVRDPQVFGVSVEETCWRFIERVMSLERIDSITVDRGRATATIRYQPRELHPTAVLLSMATALNNGRPSRPHRFVRPWLPATAERVFTVFRAGDGSSPAAVPAGEPIRPARGLRRLAYLVLAGGSFFVGIVGIIVPGIPTVPFVLVSSYYLVRSSPPLNERLLRSRTFGPMIRDWHQHGAMRPSVKVVTLAIMVGVGTVSVLLSDLSGPPLIVVLLLVGLGIYSVLRLPTLTADEHRTVGRGTEVLWQA